MKLKIDIYVYLRNNQMNRIKEVLQIKKVKQVKLARQLDVKPGTVWRWCDNNGESKSDLGYDPPLDKIKEIALLLGVPYKDLLI